MSKQILSFILVMSILSFFGCGPKGPPKMKTIKYRGGIVEFRIPASWREEYDENGGGTFYEDGNESAIFRLSLMTFKSPTPTTTLSSVEALKVTRQAENRTVETLANGNALLRYTEAGTEQGNKLKIMYWQVANIVPPEHVRIAVFSYTILESQENEKKFKDEITLLDSEIRSAAFAKVLGQ
jgi:hypothetical protein